MAQSQHVLRQDKTASVAEGRHGKQKLDELDAGRVARHLLLFDPDQVEVAALMAQARSSIPGLGKTGTIQAIIDHGFARMFAVARKSRFDSAHPAGEGFILVLFLNQIGLMQMALGTFNGPDPDHRLLAKPHERPAGIYMWCVYAPGPLAGSLALFMDKIVIRRVLRLDRPAADAAAGRGQSLFAPQHRGRCALQPGVGADQRHSSRADRLARRLGLSTHASTAALRHLCAGRSRG